MRLALPLAFCVVALAGCATSGPLPAPVQDLVGVLEGRGLQLTPCNVCNGQAFERVDSTALVASYTVRGIEPPTRRRTLAVLDAYVFETEAHARAGLPLLRHIHPVGRIYADGPLVAVTQGATPGLELAMRRRFGPPVDG